jgi:phosphate uptake regulator
METRKVQEVGGGTYTVSIPVHWADEYDIEAGVTVYLYTHFDGSLVVRRREKEYSELAAIDIQLNTHDPSATERVLRAAYTAGFKRITLNAPDGFTRDQHRVINGTTQDLTGVEIAEQTGTHTTIQVLLDARDVSIRQSVLQLRFITLSMHEAAMAAFIGDSEEVEYIFQRDSEADRVYQLITRQFNRSLVDFEELDQLGLTRSQLFRYFITTRQLERVADHAAKIAGVVHRMDGECCINNELLTEVAALAEDSRQVVESATDAVVNQSSIEQVHYALDLCDDVVERGSEIDDLLIEQGPSKAYLLTRILDSLVRTAKYGGNIAEIAVQNSIFSHQEKYLLNK